MASLTVGGGDVTGVKGLSEQPDSLSKFVMLPEVARGGRTINLTRSALPDEASWRGSGKVADEKQRLASVNTWERTQGGERSRGQGSRSSLVQTLGSGRKEVKEVAVGKVVAH
ncbi:hypothetical protein SCLCIDRAFT_34760 [Scleroderma citrinum Foug A]|uniref:Uncharacterized protein n=1 Tax=Scleroderma citrinum Foug A TaxID=1036808 RepID=A0A0C3D0U5_9AGAM|nr:hypothetical protein SCLCIDRAFT_34760 [Scleroderma citrinum Foug A]